MTSTTTKRPEEIWLEYVESLLWQKGNLDLASYDAFLRAASLGVSAAVAIQEVAERIRASGDHPRPGKLEQQWRRAALHVKANPDVPIVPAVQRPTFDPERAKRVAERVPPSVDMAWLKRHSPLPTWITSAEYLSAIFPLRDQVLVFSNQRSQGDALYENRSLRIERNALDSFVSGHEAGVWFLSNPVDGLYHDNPRQGGQSRRSQESITAWRYAVLECDHKPKETWLPIWLRILVQLPLPIVSITYSGDKSLHALVRIDAASKAAWDQFVRGHLLPRVVSLGADPQALRAVQLTRLAGCYRGDSLQELLYLNPRAVRGPIWRPEDAQ
jgi:hypothetical protein